MKTNEQMKRYSVSGEDLRIHYGDKVTLKRIFAEIENELRLTNDVVCQYVVNGHSLSEAEEKVYGKLTLADVHSLEYLSQNSHILVIGVLQGWRMAIPEMIQRTENIGDVLENKGVHEVVARITQFADDCECFVTSLLSIRTMLGDNVGVSQISWIETENRTRRAVSACIKALNTHSFELLTQILEYELSAVLADWLTILTELESRISIGQSSINSSTHTALGGRKATH